MLFSTVIVIIAVTTPWIFFFTLTTILSCLLHPHQQGFCCYLEKSFGNLKERGVVIGYDARAHPPSGGSSKRFASLAAAVFISRGVPVHLFSDITPTPFVVIALILSHFFCCLCIKAHIQHRLKIQDNWFQISLSAMVVARESEARGQIPLEEPRFTSTCCITYIWFSKLTLKGHVCRKFLLWHSEFLFHHCCNMLPDLSFFFLYGKVRLVHLNMRIKFHLKCFCIIHSRSCYLCSLSQFLTWVYVLV